MKLAYTRAMVGAALAGDLDEVETVTDPIFGLSIPTEVPGVPSEVLNPRDTWADGADYDAAAAKLAGMFKENFGRFSGQVQDEVEGGGPK
jgi:phosphoenolpyruvate carboxykinase (ATP)